MPRVIILPAADRDIDEQTDYLERHASDEVAYRFLDAVQETFSFLARHPGTGVARESTNPAYAGIRVGPVQGFEKHLVFYRTTNDGIEVVRVLHGHRDIDRIFGHD